MAMQSITCSEEYSKGIVCIRVLKWNLGKLAALFLNNLEKDRNENNRNATKMLMKYEEIINNRYVSRIKPFIFPIFDQEILVSHAIHLINGNNKDLANPIQYTSFQATNFEKTVQSASNENVEASTSGVAGVSTKKKLEEFQFKQPKQMQKGKNVARLHCSLKLDALILEALLIEDSF